MTQLSSVLDLIDAHSLIKDTKKKFKIAESTRSGTPVSTGMLMKDLLLSGGIYPGGWYTFFGKEQSCKTTSMVHSLVSLHFSNVPIIVYMDCEGSTSPEYIEQIAHIHTPPGKEFNLHDLFGLKDPSSGQYVVKPRVELSPENSLESVWKAITKILRGLPDKTEFENQWWLLFPNTKQNISRFSADNCKKNGWTRNKRLEDQSGKIAIEAPDGGTMQALFIVDSYKAMLPDSMDDDDGDDSLALAARLHAKYVPGIKGKLRRKHCTLVGVNQLYDALNIGNPYGPKESETGGNALKFFSDARIKHTARAIPHNFGTGQVEEEQSVDGKGMDTYRYIHAKAIKNKQGTPFLEAFYRLWVADREGNGCGFDPVWDTYCYLEATGQLTGNMKKMTVNVDQVEIGPIDWMTFKGLILLTGDRLQRLCKSLGLKKNPKIRERCFTQMADGRGIKWYFSVKYGYDLEETAPAEGDYSQWTIEQLIEEALARYLIKTRKIGERKGKPALIDMLTNSDE